MAFNFCAVTLSVNTPEQYVYSAALMCIMGLGGLRSSTVSRKEDEEPATAFPFLPAFSPVPTPPASAPLPPTVLPRCLFFPGTSRCHFSRSSFTPWEAFSPPAEFHSPSKAQHKCCLQSSLFPPQLCHRVLFEPLWHSYFYFALCVFSAPSGVICTLFNDKDYDLFTSVLHLPLDLFNSQHCGGNKLSRW